VTDRATIGGAPTSADRLSRLAGSVGIVGVGNTDYSADYRLGREPERRSEKAEYALRALEVALDDAGMGKDDLDGIVVTPGLPYERFSELAGLDLGWAAEGDAARSVVLAATAIATGLATCVALVYGNDARTSGRAYGGKASAREGEPKAYTFHSPWGLTSQGAFYALMTNRYLSLHGVGEADLGTVAVRQRDYASRNPKAIRQERITVDDYLASPYIASPLRRMDYCLVNDGGVALVLTTAERASSLGRPWVSVDGIGWSDLNRDATNLRPRLVDFYHTAHRRAAEQAYAMSGCGPEDIDCVQIYDSFSCHVPVALEGFGFCQEGQGLRLLAGDHALPVNTSGGHLSESYMHGWNHQVEAVRQLRNQAGERQVVGCRRAQYICDAAGAVRTLVYGAR
jgi:acetyl-CoA acetyltransferase